jgi:hypothetical protein
VNIDEAMSAAAEKLSGETSEPVTEAAPEADETQPTETTQPEATKAERVRDDSGRFTKAGDKPVTEKPPAAPKGDVHGAAQAAPPTGPGKVEGAAPSPAPSTEPVKPDAPVKLPSSWKPAAREALAKAPREVQEEALRIDREVRQVMQESAEAKRTAETVTRTLAPF